MGRRARAKALKGKRFNYAGREDAGLDIMESRMLTDWKE